MTSSTNFLKMNRFDEIIGTAIPRSGTSSSGNAVRAASSRDIRSSTRIQSLTSNVAPAQAGLHSDPNSDSDSNYDDAPADVSSGANSDSDSSVSVSLFSEVADCFLLLTPTPYGLGY
ncbi:hypothetical protein INT47_012057 [Mucor saturninus]|uniref:Uncharacterized protein n=1 Tax=Mucor saturninus TaxID=64648 RepID=A0A8H7QJ95_9FUNG|nr:hypothetical protein INT47_012057 [Mucor saturninus]